MTLEPAQLAALLSLRNAGRIGADEAIHPGAIADVLAPTLAADGYRYSEDDAGRSIVYRLTTEAPLRVSYDGARAVIDALALDALTRTATLDGPGIRRARTTLAILTKRQRGAEAWLRTLTASTRDRLPALTPDEEAAITRAALGERRARAAAKATAKPIHDAKAELGQVRDLVHRWLGTLVAGRHLRGDLWAMFCTQREASAKLRDTDHPALRVGRTTFYSLLVEFGDVRAGGGHKLYLVIPIEQEPAMLETIHAEAIAYGHLADEAERATAAVMRYRELVGDPTAQRDRVEGQRERLAATGTDGVIVDLDAARVRRHTR